MNASLEVLRAVGAMRVVRNTMMANFTRKLVLLRPTCSKGCTHCCYWPIVISVLEGAEIYLHLKQSRRWTNTLQENLVKAADAVTGLDYSIWTCSGTPCAFLTKTGQCSIYEVRPASCRTAASVGDPLECQAAVLQKAKKPVRRVDDLMAFHEAERAILKQYNADYHTMPIPTAVLVAQRLCKGEYLLWQAGPATFAEHLGRI